jgi:hypothetical protein
MALTASVRTPTATAAVAAPAAKLGKAPTTEVIEPPRLDSEVAPLAKPLAKLAMELIPRATPVPRLTTPRENDIR